MKFKPCPFCGGSEKYQPKLTSISVPWSSTTITVECDNCGAHCGYFDNEKDAVLSWNTRPSNWISVDDRLPSHGQTIWGVDEDGYQDSCEYDKRYDAFYCSSNGVVMFITHWQLLTEPPKGE